MIEYKIIEEKIQDPKFGDHMSFGICVLNDKEEIVKISDVFENAENAIHFVDKINAEGLELEHLDAVIEDYLLGYSW